MQDGAGGGVRILVEGYVNSGVPALINQSNHTLAHAVHRAVVVGDMCRNTASLPNLDGLPERVQQLISLGIPGMSHVETAHRGNGLADRRQLVCIAVGARRIG